MLWLFFLYININVIKESFFFVIKVLAYIFWQRLELFRKEIFLFLRVVSVGVFHVSSWQMDVLSTHNMYKITYPTYMWIRSGGRLICF